MMQRYSYGLVSAIAALFISSAAGAYADDLAALRQNYVDQGYGMFLHYNMGTHTGEDWAHSGLNVNTFTPTASIAAGTDQWAAVAKAAGMTYGVLTTKHHDGFSIYDTALSTYDIASTSWYNDPTNVNYQTDIVQSYADSFRSQGLGVGLYYSIWDKANGIGSKLYADEPTVAQKTSAEATTYVKAEINHLLTAYGPIEVLWTDGWQWRDGYNYVNYDEVYAYVKQISPNTLLLENNHYYQLDHTDIVGYEQSPLPPAGNTLPSEVCATIRTDGHWFYKADGADSLKSAHAISSEITISNSRNAAYLLDVPPDQSGQIPAGSVQRLMEIKAVLGGATTRSSAQFHLGESGTVIGANNMPLDSSGNDNHFLYDVGAPTVVDVSGGAPGSTKALNFSGAQGYYYTAADFVPEDDFRIEFWAKPTTVTGSTTAYLFTLGEVDGYIWIGLWNGNWAASHQNVDWIGAAEGAGQPATAGEWTKLAVEQVDGVSTFYINDVAQTGISSYTDAAVNGGLTMHLGVKPGGTFYYNGALDELTISAVVPEPSACVVFLSGLLGMSAYAWRRRMKGICGLR